MRLPAQTGAEFARATLLVGLEARDDVYHALRTLAISRPEHIPLFDEAFELFFGGVLPAGEPEPSPTTLGTLGGVFGSEGDEDEEAEVADQTGASAVERLARRDFSELSPGEIDAVRRLIARMVWAPASARSRRWMPAAVGGRPDLRKTLRQAVGPAGDFVHLASVTRRPRLRPLLVIADVSGSMERYVELLLTFAHAARGRLGRVEAFVFSTRLTRITRQLHNRDLTQALARVGEEVADWSGGTLIGSALETFNRQWSRRVVRGGPVALIVSDGWDRGDPDLLREEMARFARSVHRVIWLNPLAGRPGFAPETRGMRTVLPLVDDFLPVANLVDLTEVVRLLESVPARRREVRTP